MAILIAPNGVEVNASEEAIPRLLEFGYTRAEAKAEQTGKPKRTTRKRTTKE